MLPQTRIQWIDVAKLIGIYLVILGHINMTYNELIVFIFSFHMPLFFFLSGLTAKKESVIVSFTKSVKSILLPYVCMYLILYIKSIATILYKPERFEDGFLKPFLGLFVGVGYDTEYSVMACVPLWFLTGLFCCKMLFSLIHYIFSGKNYFRVVCSVCIFAKKQSFVSTIFSWFCIYGISIFCYWKHFFTKD